MKLQGIFPALTTSFDYEGHLYQAKITHNIQKLNEINLSGYVVCGSTGEAPLLGIDERIQLMRWVREASAEGKVLIAGVGCESVHETVRLSDRAAEAGYDVALVLTPHYYRGQMHRPEAQALFFRAVADRSKLPVLLYNLPQATGYSLSPETVAELSHHPNIIGIKDSSGNLDNLTSYREGRQAGVSGAFRFRNKFLRSDEQRRHRSYLGHRQSPAVCMPHDLGSVAHAPNRSGGGLAAAHFRRGEDRLPRSMAFQD